MDLPRAEDAILPFLAAKTEASLALPCSINWKFSPKCKLGLGIPFPLVQPYFFIREQLSAKISLISLKIVLLTDQH